MLSTRTQPLTPNPYLCVLPFSLLAGVLASCRSEDIRDRPPLDPVSLESLFDRAARAVRAETGARLEGLDMRVATLQEVTDALYRENIGRVPESQVDDEDADRRRRAVAEAYAKCALAKYSPETNEVLIRPEAFAEFAEVLGIREVNSEGQVMSVLLHEVVHAADEELFGFSSIMRRLQTDDAGRAYNAVVEGHAQFVARGLADGLGLSESFALYTRTLSAAPESAGASGMQTGHSALVAAIYEGGERFIEALHAAGGDEAIRRVFLEPPTDLSSIAHPEWFLHPDTRPRVNVDLDAGLDVITKALAGHDGWVERRVSLSEREFAAYLTPLTPDEIAPIAEALLQNRQLTASHKDGAQTALTLMEFASAEDALKYIAAFSKMRRLRDEAKQKEGRIEGATYRTLADPDPNGFLYEQTTLIGDTPVKMSGLCAAKGPVVGWLAALHFEWHQPLRLMNKVLGRVSPSGESDGMNDSR